MNNSSVIQSLGLNLPSPAYIAGSFAFGLIGFVAHRYGKRMERTRTKWLGIALMLYPYTIAQTWLLYVVGAALCAGLYIDRV